MSAIMYYPLGVLDDDTAAESMVLEAKATRVRAAVIHREAFPKVGDETGAKGFVILHNEAVVITST